MNRCNFALALVAALGVSAPGAAAPKDPRRPEKALTLQEVNSANFNPKAKTSKGLNAVVLKAQVLLDRARFSPGVIDGRGGENMRKAVAAFAQAQGLKSRGELNQDVWAKLTEAAGEPVLLEYTITEADVKGPFVEKIPDRMEEQASLDRLGYTSPDELLSEKFHMSQDLLKALNPGRSFNRAGTSIVVANVASGPAKDTKSSNTVQEKVTKIEVDKKAGALRAYTKDGKLFGVYPASIGSTEKPTPSGIHKVETVAMNPTYTYNPEYKFAGVNADKPFTIKPGPNNPVGSVWIDLDAPSYGIHGTPHPEKVSKAYSQGCVRLTNWDAEALAKMVQKGTVVEFRE